MFSKKQNNRFNVSVFFVLFFVLQSYDQKEAVWRSGQLATGSGQCAWTFPKVHGHSPDQAALWEVINTSHTHIPTYTCTHTHTKTNILILMYSFSSNIHQLLDLKVETVYSCRSPVYCIVCLRRYPLTHLSFHTGKTAPSVIRIYSLFYLFLWEKSTNKLKREYQCTHLLLMKILLIIVPVLLTFP